MELAMKIEEMAYEAETLRSLALTVYDAIYNGCNDYKEYDHALNLVFCMAHEHTEHMNLLVDEVFSEWREENKKGFGERERGGDNNAKSSIDCTAAARLQGSRL